ncbi:phosphoglycerate mutase [Frateuria aurantia]
MAQAATSLEIWLPPRSLWGPAKSQLTRWLARAEPAEAGPADVQAAIEQGFRGVGGEPLPVAALLRQWLAGDAGSACWLAADPAWIQPDMNGARLLACQYMQLEGSEVRALATDLGPLFAEQDIVLQMDDLHYWQLKLPEGMTVPVLAPPSQAMGDDVLAFVPAGPEGRRWRLLFNDAQTLLHAHPVNQRRMARGLPPVNSLWFWGGGRLPQRLDSRWQGVLTVDPVLLAAAAAAGLGARPVEPSSLESLSGPWLLDLQTLEPDHWPAWLEMLARQLARMPVRWRLSDGRSWRHHPLHRLRFWRSTWTG